MTTSEKRRPGRPPAGEKATTSTERMRVLRQKRRDEEVRQLAAERAEAERVRQMRTYWRVDAGLYLNSLVDAWDENKTNQTKEHKEYIRLLAKTLSTGRTRLPE